VTHEELMISLFHASGEIWPELGEPVAVPTVYEMAVYCDFPEPANLQAHADEESLERKIVAIEAFESQRQITALIQHQRDAGPYEYLREVSFRFYSPQSYQARFV
jgi:hypothetical protein